jgi:hypothetical protein
MAFAAIAWLRPGCSAALALRMLFYRVRPNEPADSTPQSTSLLIEFACLRSTSARTGRDEGREKLREEKLSNNNGFFNTVNRAG